jgi:hypothetical protein
MLHTLISTIYIPFKFMKTILDHLLKHPLKAGFILLAIALSFLGVKTTTSPIFSDKQAASKITFITTTNPIQSIPSTEIIYESMKSFYQVPALRKCKKIIVFDGIQPGFENREKDYEQYKKNILELTKTSPYFANTELVFCPSWHHLSGAIKLALEQVDTPFIFVHQHDFLLRKKIKLNELLTSMSQNQNIKYVRLNQGSNVPHRKGEFHHLYDGDVDNVVEGGTLAPLTRNFGWSDNDHFARTDYYRDFVLPRCGFGAMECYLHPLLKESLTKNGPDDGHKPFGTYIYGGLKDGKYIKHLDGRNSKLSEKAD